MKFYEVVHGRAARQRPSRVTEGRPWDTLGLPAPYPIA